MRRQLHIARIGCHLSSRCPDCVRSPPPPPPKIGKTGKRGKKDIWQRQLNGSINSSFQYVCCKEICRSFTNHLLLLPENVAQNRPFQSRRCFCYVCFRNVTLDSSLPTRKNVCPVTVMVIPMSAWTAQDSVW